MLILKTMKQVEETTEDPEDEVRVKETGRLCCEETAHFLFP